MLKMKKNKSYTNNFQLQKYSDNIYDKFVDVKISYLFNIYCMFNIYCSIVFITSHYCTIVII